MLHYIAVVSFVFMTSSRMFGNSGCEKNCEGNDISKCSLKELYTQHSLIINHLVFEDILL